jgi:hypothetical protein
MKDLIEALTIFAKYKNHDNPTHCEHDELMVVDIGFHEVSPEDRARLDELGFIWSEDDPAEDDEDDDGHWLSFRFGSA